MKAEGWGYEEVALLIEKREQDSWMSLIICMTTIKGDSRFISFWSKEGQGISQGTSKINLGGLG